YDSALLFVESIGNRFGFLIVDECHHLPAAQYQNIAYATIAPFRLGLSATPERADGKDSMLGQLVGEIVYHGHIGDMVSSVLSPYDVVSVRVGLTDEEKTRYGDARSIYVSFLKRHQIDFRSPR